MNTGMYMKEDGKMYVYVFKESYEVPFHLLNNAFVQKEIKGHYTISGTLTNNIGIDAVEVIKNGKKWSGQIEEVVGEKWTPNFQWLEKQLLVDGFYKTDKANFLRMENKYNYEKRFRLVREKFQ